MATKPTSTTKNIIRECRRRTTARDEREVLLRMALAYKVILDVQEEGGQIYAIKRTGEDQETKELLEFI